MKNELARLVVLIVGFAGTGSAWAEEVAPPDRDLGIVYPGAMVVIDVDGNAQWVPPPAGEEPSVPDDRIGYTPGYDMDRTAKVSVDAGGIVTDQVFALIVYVPGVRAIGGFVDFKVHYTSRIPGIAGNMSSVGGRDFLLSRRRPAESTGIAVKGVGFGNAFLEYGWECAVVYVHCRDYGGRATITFDFHDVKLEDGTIVPAPPPYLIPYRFPLRRRAYLYGETIYGADELDEDDATDFTHTVTGDKLTVFEEYRGLFINGTHRDLDVARGYDGQSTGGPLFKDGFFVDDTGKIPTDAANLMSVLGVSWHVIRLDEMKATNAKPAGVVNFNAEHGDGSHVDYRCIRFVNADLTGRSASARGFLSNGLAIRIDVTDLDTSNNDDGLTPEEAKQVYGWFAGHEAGHLVGLDHPQNHRKSYVRAVDAPTPGADGYVDDTKYWVVPREDWGTLTPQAQQTVVGTWIAVNARGDRFAHLEAFVDALESEASSMIVGKVRRPVVDHDAIVLKAVLAVDIDPTDRGFVAANAPVLETYAHGHRLSDHMIDTFTPQNTLNVAETITVDVKK